MQLSDILTLAKAGFTAQQIAAINAALAPAPAPAPAPALAPDPAAEILKQLGVISGQINSAAIVNTQQPRQQTTDEILAEIITPPRKED